jgi:hypothetical protein
MRIEKGGQGGFHAQTDRPILPGFGKKWFTEQGREKYPENHRCNDDEVNKKDARPVILKRDKIERDKKKENGRNPGNNKKKCQSYQFYFGLFP